MAINTELLSGKHILFGVTGGIAAYKACEVCSGLRKAGADVHVIMTRNAQNFVHPITFETLSLNPVVTDTFDRSAPWEVEHIALAKQADAVLIAPATANIMAKLACGIADDMLSTTVLATKAPVLLAPAMNTGMWTNAATQHNRNLLSSRGYLFVGPEGGRLACGDTGEGRMSEPETVIEALAALFASEKELNGVRVTVTAGPTREFLDPIRFLSNRSTGKMGYAIARQAARRGAEVTLITGPVNIPVPAVAKVIGIRSTEELKEAVLSVLPDTDILIQAAAPADYTPISVSAQKIKKTGDELALHLKKTPDVAKEAGKLKQPHQVFIGFAAETENIEAYADEKREGKNLDMICANDASGKDTGFESDTNQLTFMTRDMTEKTPLVSKEECAAILVRKAADLYRLKNKV